MSAATPVDPSKVIASDNGTFIPYCELCAYVGKSRERRFNAEAAIRQHRTAPSHKRAVRRATLAAR